MSQLLAIIVHVVRCIKMYFKRGFSSNCHEHPTDVMCTETVKCLQFRTHVVGTLALSFPPPPMLITMTCCMANFGSLNIEGKGEPQLQTVEYYEYIL